MTIINFEHPIFSKGSVFNPEFKKVFGYNPATSRFIMEKDILDKTPVEVYRVFDPSRLTMYIDHQKATLEQIVTYFYSLDLQSTLENVPQSLQNKLYNTDAAYDNLLRILKDINSGGLKVTVKETADEDEPSVKYIEDTDGELEGMCCGVLIASGGQPNWEYISKLKAEGFKVYPTEKDSFGWLGAAVRTNKGVIFFG
jgi:hypothetical protein